MAQQKNPLTRIWSLMQQDKSEITAIYFYAVLAGIIQLSLPVGLQSIISFVLGGTMSASLIVLIILVVTGVLVTGLIYINQMKLIEKIQQKIFVRYTIDFAQHIPKIDLQKADTFYLPELVNRFFEIPVLQKAVSKLLIDIPTATIQILFGLLLLSFYHPSFILFSLLLIIVLFFIIYYTGAKGLRTSLAESSFKYATAAWLEELARAIRSFKLSKGTFIHLKKSDEKASSYLNARKDHFNVLLFQYKLLVTLKTVITAAMLFVGSYLLVNQQLNIGQFIAAEIVILIVIGAVEKIIARLDSVYDVLTSVEKIGKLTDKPVEKSGTLMFPDKNKGATIELVDVGINFPGSGDILQNLSFKVEAGQKICILGEEGSGKSTLLRLLAGTFSEFSGSVLIDSVPIHNYDIDSLRAKTGIFINQQDIFHGTLMENITMGNSYNNMEEIKSSVEKVGLHSYVNSLQNGYDTELDPVGNHLPGGVIRKILLLRALINKPRLILLEEPWSGFPDQLKKDIQHILLNETAGSTVVVVSNDESFAEKCHQQIRLKKYDNR